MRKSRLVVAIVLASLVLAAGAVTHAAGFGLSFVAPHRVMPRRATLSASLIKRIESETKRRAVSTPREAIDLALEMTARHLHFGLDHRTRMYFDTAERQGHCVEYAQLFAAVFQRIVARSGLRVRAYVVRSDARLLGQRIEKPGWRDHDWVLVIDASSLVRWFVDPTLWDTGMGWDVHDNVRGPVRIARRKGPRKR